MSKRRRFLIASFAALVLGFATFAWYSRGPAEPSYQGKRLSEWLREHPDYVDGFAYLPKSSKSSLAVRATGTNALPILMIWIQAEDSPLKKRMIEFIRAHPRISFHPLADFEKKAMAIEGFSALRNTAWPAFPALKQMLQAGDNSRAVGAAMFAIDPDAAWDAGVLGSFSFPPDSDRFRP